MGKFEKLLERLLRGGADAGINFDDLCGLLRYLGFEERARSGGSSHRIFKRAGVEELVNLQRSGPNAKPYQVRQVRTIVVKYGLGGNVTTDQG